MGFCASRERKAQHSPTLPLLLSLASVCTNEHTRDSFTGPRGVFSRLRCRPSFAAHVQNKLPPLIGNVVPRHVGRAPCETAFSLQHGWPLENSNTVVKVTVRVRSHIHVRSIGANTSCWLQWLTERKSQAQWLTIDAYCPSGNVRPALH